MQVTVVDRQLLSRLWGNGYRGIQQVIRTVDISDECQVCGEPRGKPTLRRYCDDGEFYSVSNWSNDCGHADMYADVLQEVQTVYEASA